MHAFSLLLALALPALAQPEDGVLSPSKEPEADLPGLEAAEEPSAEEAGERDEPAAREIERPINLWPLVYRETGPDRTQLELLFSLIYYERDRRKLSLGFRPFYSRLNDPDRDASKWSFLWPLATYDRKEDTRKLRVLPLYWQKLSPPDSYSVFFPLYSYHRDEERRRLGVLGYSPYSIFDLRKDYVTGGTRNRYLLVVSEREGETRSFTVAPLYSQTRSPEAGSASLFPVFHRSWNRPEGFSHFSLLGMPDRFNVFETKRHDKADLREWHFLTVFSRMKGDDRMRVFAPFYWRLETEDLDVFHLWPFYGTHRSDFRVERSVAYPFFRWASDPSEGETELNLVWPLYKRHRRPQFRHDRVFPLFSWTRQSESDEAPRWTPIGLLSPLPVAWRSTGLDYSYNRFFWLAWATRKGDRRRDVVLNYYNFSDSSDGRLNRGLFPLWHRSRWGGNQLDLAPLFVSYERKGEGEGAPRALLFRTFFPLYWDYRSSTTTFTAGVPLFLRYRSGGYDFTTLFPFYYHSTDSALGSELTYYFPFYGTYRRGDFSRRHLLFFPLWSRLKDEEAGLSSWDVMWPLFHYESSPQRFSVRALPLYWHRRTPEGAFAIGFPLYWHFRSVEGRQTHVLPFYGDYERPGFRLRYVLGPLWVRMQGEQFDRTDLLGSLWSSRRFGDERKTHVFPVFWRRTTPGYGRWVFLPLVGAERAAPSYRSFFLLGVHRGVNLFELGSDPAEEYRLVRFLNVLYRRDRASHFGTFFPLYWAWGDNSASGSILFPLYSTRRNRDDGSYDHSFLGLPEGLSLVEFSKDRTEDQDSERLFLYYHRRVGERHMRTVFPLFWRWSEPERRRTYLFPLYASRALPDDRRLGLLGFGPNLSLFSYGTEKGRVSHRLFPLYGFRERKNETELSLLGPWHKISFFHASRGPDSIRHRFFPIYGYEREGRPGDRRHRVATSLLWRALYYEREGDNTDLRVLFRLVRVKKGPVESAFELNPLYFSIREKDSRYWAVLGGLFGVETRADGSKKYRYFWFF